VPSQEKISDEIKLILVPSLANLSNAQLSTLNYLGHDRSCRIVPIVAFVACLERVENELLLSSAHSSL